jgi:hypothetical protein
VTVNSAQHHIMVRPCCRGKNRRQNKPLMPRRRVSAEPFFRASGTNFHARIESRRYAPANATGEETMKRLLMAVLAMAISTGSVLGQQAVAPKGPEIDLPDVVAEVQAAYDRYNKAVNAGTIGTLNNTFWKDSRTIRYGQAENLYGYQAIEGFRAAARPLAPPRTLSSTVITTYGRDFAVASTLTYRANQPGRVGRQMQTWVRFPDGWHVVAAHVSTIDEPK